MSSPNKKIDETNTQEIEVEGHLIDSMILTKIFDIIMDYQGDFEVQERKSRFTRAFKSYAPRTLSIGSSYTK
jgi:hypothetical protein